MLTANASSDEFADCDCRWGILGCANIARKAIRALSHLSIESRDKIKLVGLASRSIDTAKTFAIENGLLFDNNDNDSNVTLYEGYQALLDDPRIDAVYIPLPTTLHVEWAVKAAKSGKSILLEKPCAVTADELRTILAACAEHRVAYMDGVMFMHNTRLARLKELLRDPLAGNVVRIHSSFCFNGSHDFLANNIRVKSDADPLGALGDLGWYCVRLGLVVFGEQAVSCSARCNAWTADGKVPLDVDATIWFDTDLEGTTLKRSLRFSCSFLLPFHQEAKIYVQGDPSKDAGDSSISLDDFVIPRCESTSPMQLEYFPTSGPFARLATKVLATRETVNCANPRPQESSMFQCMSRYAKGAKLGDANGMKEASYWGEISLATQNVMDACLASMQSGGAVMEIPK